MASALAQSFDSTYFCFQNEIRSRSMMIFRYASFSFQEKMESSLGQSSEKRNKVLLIHQISLLFASKETGSSQAESYGNKYAKTKLDSAHRSENEISNSFPFKRKLISVLLFDSISVVLIKKMIGNSLYLFRNQTKVFLQN